jgi:protein required for attachment to host cells
MAKKVSVPKGGLVVVADYGKALLIKNSGSPVAPVLEIQQVLEAPENPPSHEQGSDRPGRAVSGNRRSAVEQTDWHSLAGTRFMEQTAAALERACAGEPAPIVLVAPPKALADLRSAISDNLRTAVVGEIDKDLTHMSISDISRYLAA